MSVPVNVAPPGKIGSLCPFLMAQPFLSPHLFTHRLSPRLALVQLLLTPVPLHHWHCSSYSAHPLYELLYLVSFFLAKYSAVKRKTSIELTYYALTISSRQYPTFL
ncbi:hypothetical protein BJV74DRAFT_840942 [Russula compacta]|nr:hypothetical protein BJV74DRAFT_840942 [Russula compacta]